MVLSQAQLFFATAVPFVEIFFCLQEVRAIRPTQWKNGPKGSFPIGLRLAWVHATRPRETTENVPALDNVFLTSNSPI